MDIRVTLILYIQLLFAFYLLWLEGVLKARRNQIIAAVLLGLAFLLRYLGLDWRTGDYESFLSVWVEYFRQNGGWRGLADSIGNYNVTYLYFLALFSYSEVADLYLIKLLSIFFDVVLAWAGMRLFGLFNRSETGRMGVFLGVLLLPTVILNGSLWGQCDSIYGAFALLSVYLALADRPVLSMMSIAASLAMKLQAVFIMPLFFIFLFKKKLKIWHLAIFPLTYVAILMPAVLAGRDFWETLTFYLREYGSAGMALNYNSSSVFSMINLTGQALALVSRWAVPAAFGLCAAVYAWFFLRRRDVDNLAMLGAGLIFAVGIPFLLPHMHDRYFFCADVLSLVFAAVFPWAAFIPVCVSLGSAVCYWAYLKGAYIVGPAWGGRSMLLALVMTLVCVAVRLYLLPGAKKLPEKNLEKDS